MALSFPYPLAFLNARLQPGDVSITFLDSSEMSGSGDGRFWGARLRPNLWAGQINLGLKFAAQARELDAKIRALGQGQQTFLFTDPTYWPAGGVHPGNGTTIGAIGTYRDTITVAGLPAGYKVFPGDRFSFVYSATKYYYGEFVEGTNMAEADPDLGRPAIPDPMPTPALTTGSLTINPPIPFGVSAGIAIELFNPVLKAVVPKNGYTPFSGRRGAAMSGAGRLSFVQKVG